MRELNNEPVPSNLCPTCGGDLGWEGNGRGLWSCRTCHPVRWCAELSLCVAWFLFRSAAVVTVATIIAYLTLRVMGK